MRFVRTLLTVAAAIGIWEWLARDSYRIRILVSSPFALSRYATTHYAGLMRDLLYTASVVIFAFGIALAAGAAVAIASFRWSKVLTRTRVALSVLQVLPVLVFAPFVVMMLGIGWGAHVFIAAIVAVYPFAAILVDALLRIPSVFSDLVKLYRIGFLRSMMHVFLPQVAPAGFAGARVTFATSVVGAVVAEFTGARRGLGRNVFEGAIRLEPELLVLSTLAIVAMGLAGGGALRIAERSCVRWQA